MPPTTPPINLVAGKGITIQIPTLKMIPITFNISRTSAPDQGPRVPPHKGDVWESTINKTAVQHVFTGEYRDVGSPSGFVYNCSCTPDCCGVSIYWFDKPQMKFISRGTDAPPKPAKHLPHKCTRCSSPSFNMALSVECSNPQCACYKP